jgi:hypothetical protein
MSHEELKLKAFGLYKSHCLQHPPETFDLIKTAEKLDCKAGQVRRWIKDYESLDESASVASLVNVDALLVERITNEVAHELEEAEPYTVDAEEEPDNLVVNPITGLVEVRQSEVVRDVNPKIAAFRDNLKGLQLLEEETRIAAGALVEQISKEARYGSLEPKELASLASALTSIQNAFFNKPVTNVQVNNISGGSGLLSELKERLKP